VTSPILLTTLNARYHHSAFGLRYLYANLQEFQSQTKIIEFTTSQNSRDLVEILLSHQPKVIGFGIYIWNTRQTLEVISILKRVRPDIVLVLGGPEVSFENREQPICQLADFTIQGEADSLFYEFCRAYLKENQLPSSKWISGPLPEVKKLASPYQYYSDEDIRSRIIYVEASRGCPYKCEYCLSSLDKSVRSFDLEWFLTEMQTLIDRGARQFKFVDRTFNLSISTSIRILQFFLDRMELGLFLHFEMVPDRLPVELRDLIQKFPPGSLQFEIGIQTWSPEVAKLVSRRQDYSKIKENFKFLVQETGVHIHADLIAGLPGETLDSFAQGFDAVSALGPDEIQVGILKRLKGTPIIRHDQVWEMLYQEHSPFQILSTKTMSFFTLQDLNRFAHFWDLIANSGNFKNSMILLKNLAAQSEKQSLFWTFFEMSKFLALRHPQGHGVALLNLLESVWIYLTQHLRWDLDLVRSTLIQDYAGTVKRDIPHFLREAGMKSTPCAPDKQSLRKVNATPQRQARHLAV
jgi:radical SAM superfamily enzyme YgiQ (UPF0313 family)